MTRLRARILPHSLLTIPLAACAFLSCSESVAPKSSAPELLWDLEKGIYHAVKETYGKNSFSLYPRTYEGANQGMELAQFGFKLSGDSIVLYALPYSDVSCLKKVSSARIDSVSDSSFILKPVKTSDFYLHFQSILNKGNQGFAITLVGRSHGEYYEVNTYSYYPLHLSQDSVCLNDTLDFTWGSGD